MMRAKMFGGFNGLGDDTSADTTDYSTLSDAACALIPACAAAKGLGTGAADAASSAANDALTKAQEAATQVMAPTLAELQRLEKVITWAAVAAGLLLAAATGTMIYFGVKKRS